MRKFLSPILKPPTHSNIFCVWRGGSLLGVTLVVQVVTGLVTAVRYCLGVWFPLYRVIAIVYDCEKEIVLVFAFVYWPRGISGFSRFPLFVLVSLPVVLVLVIVCLTSFYVSGGSDLLGFLFTEKRDRSLLEADGGLLAVGFYYCGPLR